MMLRRPVINWLRRLSGLTEIPDTPNLNALLQELDAEGVDLKGLLPAGVALVFLLIGFWGSWELLEAITQEPLVYLAAWLGIAFGAMGVYSLCSYWLKKSRGARGALREAGCRLKASLTSWQLLWYEPVSPVVLGILESASAWYLRARAPFSSLRRKKVLEKLDPTVANALEAMEWALVDLFEAALRLRGTEQEAGFRQPWIDELLKEMRAMSEELEVRAKSLAASTAGDSMPALYRLQVLRRELQQYREAVNELEQR
ncbi:MAG: hypothetical protein K6T17_05695 [Fimbriimonadales bacterium]|nr:hypothetical protein [Fimbriimonadales bacterium]